MNSTWTVHHQPQQVPPTSSPPPAGSPPSSDLRGSNSDVMTGTRPPIFSLPPLQSASRTGFEIKSEPIETQGSMSKQPTGNSDNELMPRRLNQKEVKVEQVQPAPSSTAQNVLEGAEIGEQRTDGIVNALKNEEGLACSSGTIDTSSPHSLPVTPSIPRQNRKRKAETDGDFCSPTDGSVHSGDVSINSKPRTFTFSFINVSLTDPQDVSILEAEAKKLNVTVSNVITEKMPVGQNRYIQHFRVQNRSEKRRMSKECNKLEWKEKWALSEIIKDTASPFFVHYVRLEVPLRFIIHTIKCPERESYHSFYSKSLCKMNVKKCLNDDELISEIEKYLNEKGKKDFYDIIRTTINHFERDSATAIRLANRFLQSTR